MKAKKSFSPIVDVLASAQIRCDEGGHNVAEDKIRARYYREQPFIRDAVLMANNGLVFDNSITNQLPKHKVSFKNGKLIYTRDQLPSWILKIYESYMFFPRLEG